MGFNLPTANKGGNAPTVDDGLVVLRFDDLVLKDHPDWAGTDKFGKPDDGQRFHFMFTLVTPDGKGGYQVAYEDGDPIELDHLTRTATGEKSNFAKILKGILTGAEFLAWQANEPFDADKVQGRFINAQIGHNEKKWPQVEATLGQVKGAK